jgi:hypothetical protein
VTVERTSAPRSLDGGSWRRSSPRSSSFWSWASRQGYVSWSGTTCTAEGYDPVPSYDELITKYKKRPHCARLIRDETWF